MLPPLPVAVAVDDPAVIDTLPPLPTFSLAAPLVDPADNVNAPPTTVLPDPTVNDSDPPAPLTPAPDPT